MLVFILFASLLSFNIQFINFSDTPGMIKDNMPWHQSYSPLDKQLFDIGKKDSMQYQFSNNPSGFLNYKKITKLNYAIEKELNDPFGKNITIDFYKINYPIRYFELALPFAY